MRHGNDGGRYLHEQLYPRAQIYDVVNGPAGHYKHSAEQYAAHLPGDVREKHHAEEKTEKNSQSAHAWDGVVMHAPLSVGHVYRAHFLREGFDHRRGREAYCKGYGYGEQYTHPQRQLQIEQHIILTLLNPPR